MPIRGGLAADHVVPGVSAGPCTWFSGLVRSRMTDRAPKPLGSSESAELDDQKRRLKAIVDKVISSPEVQDAIWLAEGYKKASPGSFVVRTRDPALDFQWTEDAERSFRAFFGRGPADPEPD